ncbi:hypothetical protein ES703_121424 [subsurface metagenome]
MVRMDMGDQYRGDIPGIKVEPLDFLKNSSRAVDEEQLIILFDQKRSVIPVLRGYGSAGP